MLAFLQHRYFPDSAAKVTCRTMSMMVENYVARVPYYRSFFSERDTILVGALVQESYS